MRFFKICFFIVFVLFLSSCSSNTKSAPIRHINPIISDKKSSGVQENKKRKDIYGFSCPVLIGSKVLPGREKCEGGVIFESDGNSDTVFSALGGKVIYVGRGLRLYGNVVMIEHINRIVTMYAWLSNTYVKVGQRVYARQKIASLMLVGNFSNKLCFVPKQNDEYIKYIKDYINCN